jgi:hypothetical protein
MRVSISCATSASVASRQSVKRRRLRVFRTSSACTKLAVKTLKSQICNGRACSRQERMRTRPCAPRVGRQRQSLCVVLYRNVARGVRIELMVARYLTYLPCREQGQQACSQGFSALRTPRSELLPGQVPCHDRDREGNAHNMERHAVSVAILPKPGSRISRWRAFAPVACRVSVGM